MCKLSLNQKIAGIVLQRSLPVQCPKVWKEKKAKKYLFYNIKD